MIIVLHLGKPAAPVAFDLDFRTRRWRVIGGASVWLQHGFATAGSFATTGNGALSIFEEPAGRPKRNTLIIRQGPSGPQGGGIATFIDPPRPYFKGVNAPWSPSSEPPPQEPSHFHTVLDAFVGATGARAGLRAWLNTKIRTGGFRAAGPNSIGIVAYPRTTVGNIKRGLAPWNMETTQFLGHTAEIVRLDGKIVAVRGFEPHNIELLRQYESTMSGRGSVRAYITQGDDALLTTRYAMTAEREVSREVAEAQFARLKNLHETPIRWTGDPEMAATLGRAGEMNCVQWAVRDAMHAAPEFGAELRLGSAIPSSQGNLMKNLKEIRDLERAGEYSGPIRVGEAPRSIPYARGIGTGLFILGSGITMVELVQARGDPHEGELTGEAVGSFAGSLILPEIGVALCAVVGISMGGLALIPIAICFGVIGSELGGKAGAHLGRKLDYHPEDDARPDTPRVLTTSDDISPARW
jgi:hypothetical protein